MCAAAGVIIGVLVLLSLVLTAATLFLSLNGGQLTAIPAGGGGRRAGRRGSVGRGTMAFRAAAGLPDDPEGELDTGVVLQAERLTWRMPALSDLPRPRWSPGRRHAEPARLPGRGGRPGHRQDRRAGRRPLTGGP
jgi:hypothetical protein